MFLSADTRRPWRRAEAVVLFLATLALLALLTHRSVFLAGNDASRFATMEALVDQGTTAIDGSRYAWTVDRVRIGGHDYSNKPPLLSLAGAAVYWLLQRLTGLSLANAEGATIYWLTLLLVGLPTAWMAVRFYLALDAWVPASTALPARDRTDLEYGPAGRRAEGRGAASDSVARGRPVRSRSTAASEDTGGRFTEGNRLLAVAALVVGTLILTYSTTFNNHTVAATLLFAAFSSALGGRGLACGAWLALSICVDIVPGVVLAPPLAWMVANRSGPRGLGRFAASLAAGGGLFAAADLFTVGHLLPPKMVPGAVDASSHFADSVAGVLLPDRWSYPLECLFGWHGLFTVSPVLLCAVFGLVVAWRRGGGPLSQRETALLSAAVTVVIGGHILLVGSYGGWSYGFRYLIPIIPILAFYLPAPLSRLRPALVAPVLVLSVLFSLVGAYHPWPPAYEQERDKHPVAALVTNPIGGNLAAWAEEAWPGSSLAQRLGAAYISPDPTRRHRYLALFYASKGARAASRRQLEALKARR